MKIRAFWLMAGCLLAAGCGGGGPTDTVETRSEAAGGQRIEPRAVFPRPVYYSGMDVPAREVLRTDAQWQAAWTQVHRHQQPAPAVPAVDFGRESVVLAAMGGRNTGGYVITIDSVTATTDAVHVFVTERSPGSRCFTTQALTAPVDAVAIPADGRAVRFHENAVVHACE
ncbi:MAG TPA: protease complex subunit PrcB family protein [Longimicrobium sp.]|nr:protease complex subunit PrcB family protein [Longimicrobium sp.]